MQTFPLIAFSDVGHFSEFAKAAKTHAFLKIEYGEHRFREHEGTELSDTEEKSLSRKLASANAKWDQFTESLYDQIASCRTPDEFADFVFSYAEMAVFIARKEDQKNASID